MSWHDGRLVAFDVETTGVDYETDRIVTAAVALVGGGEETRTSEWLIDPGIEISEEATAVHGITTEHAQAAGDEAGPAIGEILEMLSERPEGAPIVAFNARFDLTMLDREARRYGLNPLGTRRELRVVDPFVLDKWLDQFRRGKRKLVDVCGHYGAELEEAHEAAADAIAAARLAWVMGKRAEVKARYPEIVAKRATWKRIRDDIDQLHVAQVVMARDQAWSLAEYFARQGKSEHVEPAWPVVPLPAAEMAA